MAAGALPLAETQQPGGSDRGRIGECVDRRDAFAARAVVPVWRDACIPQYGVLAAIAWTAEESNRDAELDPFGIAMLDESFGAAQRREARTRQGVRDAMFLRTDGGAQHCRSCGYARKMMLRGSWQKTYARSVCFISFDFKE